MEDQTAGEIAAQLEHMKDSLSAECLPSFSESNPRACRKVEKSTQLSLVQQMKRFRYLVSQFNATGVSELLPWLENQPKLPVYLKENDIGSLAAVDLGEQQRLTEKLTSLSALAKACSVRT